MPKLKMLLVTEVSKSSEKADTTFYMQNGDKYFRSKIDKNTSKTLKQQMQRLAFGEKGRIAKALQRVLAVSIPKPGKGLSPSNVFMRINDGLVTVNEDLEVTVNYPELQLGNRDDRDTPEGVTVTANSEEHSLTFSHGAEEFGSYAEPTDKLYAALYNPVLQRSELYELCTRAETEPVTVSVPSRWEMGDVHVYVFAVSEDGRSSSYSEYLTVS